MHYFNSFIKHLTLVCQSTHFTIINIEHLSKQHFLYTVSSKPNVQYLDEAFTMLMRCQKYSYNTKYIQETRFPLFTITKHNRHSRLDRTAAQRIPVYLAPSLHPPSCYNK